MFEYVVAAENTTTYNASDLCGAPANTIGYRPPGLFHTARFTNLNASETIYYRVGDAGTGVYSDMFTLLTPPNATSNVKIIAFGDLGQSPKDLSLESVSLVWYGMAWY